MKKVIDGNTLCGKIAYFMSELCFVYPITPSSTGASELNLNNELNNKNLFNGITEVYEMQSEAGVAGAMHGALMNGTLSSTFTSSQGLLLMIPNLYKMAGEGLPGVIHVASRTVATNALSIFGDHSDIYACNNTGVCIMSSANLEDIKYLGLIAHLASIKGRLPFIHFYDGFRTSHELNTTNLLDDQEILSLIDFDAIKEFKKEALANNKFERGMNVGEDIYFETVEAKNNDYTNMVDIVNNLMQEVNQKFNTNYEPFNYYGDLNATDVIVSMGSVSDTIKQVIDYENKQGKHYGLVTVHLYRPFSSDHLINKLPKSVKRVAVLDRAKTSGASGEPLYLDIVNALKDLDIKVVGGRFGLSSKNTTPAQIKAVYDNLEGSLKNNFTIGINDDVTNLSLKVDNNYHLDSDCYEIKAYGFGSDGLITCSKDLLKLIGEKTDKYVSGYFEYDSKKSGGITIGHLRVSSGVKHLPYYVDNACLVVISDDSYLFKKDLFTNILPNSVVLLNTNKKPEDLIFNEQNANLFKELNLKLYIIDASKIATECHIPGKISMIMEKAILNLLNLDYLVDELKENVTNRFKDKGMDIVNNNIDAINKAEYSEVDIDEITHVIKSSNDFFQGLANHNLTELKVSDVYDYKTGIYPGNTSKLIKTNVTKVPVWNREKCMQCNMCSIVCPYGVIRPVINSEDGIPSRMNQDKLYRVTINEDLCKACGLCINACRFDALAFNDKTNEEKYYVDKYYNQTCGKSDTLMDLQSGYYPFEYPNACSGCGEVNYLKLLGGICKDSLVIANATGCSSIYGGTAPETPYNIPWANSLFEDNAEFGLGIKRSIDLKKANAIKIIEDSIDSVDLETKELYEDYLNNQDDYYHVLEIINKLKERQIPVNLKDNINDLLPKTVAIVGGDGWAYDIGFGGIDQALSSNLDINIIVLDTESYSNTGGQASKASRMSSSLEFQNLGKKNPKKDLFKIAMTYPNVYVAETTYLANPMHTFKVFKEAINHHGPSIVICYATCIAHGIKCGLSNSIEEQKLLVDSGYELLMHYDGKMYLDSKEPDFTKLDDVFNNEVRYKKLKNKDLQLFNELVKLDKEYIKNRYEYY